jgi:hypothetical protein
MPRLFNQIDDNAVVSIITQQGPVGVEEDDHGAGSRMIWWWLTVRGPLYFWRHFDKYRFVNRLEEGYEERSESTMHEICKRPLEQSMFSGGVREDVLADLNRAVERNDIAYISDHLPSGFLQTRVVNCNLQTLRRIISQRKTHRLPCWTDFINALLRDTTVGSYV